MAFAFESLKTSLYSAVLSDTLDSLGLMDQAMKPFVRPLDDRLVVMGRARTGLYANFYGADENPYDVEITFLDDLKPGDVAVVACDGPTDRIAPWGELLSVAASCRGAFGCVTDGLVRDVRKIREMQFPVFHGGIGPLNSRGRGKMIAFDVPVECAGAQVSSGDIVFGDIDGVIVIPAGLAEQVIMQAQEKATAENLTRNELLDGRLLREVYEKYGVL